MRTSLLSALGGGWFRPGPARTLLDFACGYGRLTRFLVREIGPEAITVADIDSRAVDFCRSKFGVSGFNSTRAPDELVTTRAYDLILVASMFSHVSFALWGAWLERLYAMVQEGGLLLFSTHGMHAYGLTGEEGRSIVKEVAHGFYYVGTSETTRLSSLDYGTTYVSPEFVARVVRERRLGTLAAHHPRLLWDFQDAYLLGKW